MEAVPIETSLALSRTVSIGTTRLEAVPIETGLELSRTVSIGTARLEAVPFLLEHEVVGPVKGQGFDAGPRQVGARSLFFCGFSQLWDLFLGSRPAFLPSRPYLIIGSDLWTDFRF